MVGSLPEITVSAPLLAALASSPTFGPELVRLGLPFLLSAGLCSLGFIYLHRTRKRRPAAGLHRDERGMALAADLVLVMVPFMILILVLLQTLWMMRETVIVHYAAFNAARSARVHLCPPLPESTTVFTLQLSGKLGCDNDRRKAETAARYSLISASPAWGIPCQSNCTIPQDVIRAISVNTNLTSQAPAIMDQARYAFDRDNVTVDVDFDPKYMGLAVKKGTLPPVRARLTFRHYVLYGLGRAIGTKRSDGYFFRETVAEVTLL
jgi:hypothetical protein